ncbi:MAG: Ig-like domain-containing protein, partial [Bacteroidota bacterium]
DNTDPATPAGLNLDPTDDTGSSNMDNITRTTTGLTINGTGENGSTIELTSSVDGGLAGSVVVSGGAWSLDVDLSDNASHSITAEATDEAGNTSTASTPLVIVTDNMAPFLSPNEIALVLNDGSPETITFRMNEELGLAEGAAVSGFSVSTGAIATAIYSGKGVTNLITLTSVADNDWTASTTVSYTISNNVEDLAGNELSAIANQNVEVSLVTLSAGDIAFTGYNSDGSDNFSFVLLKDVESGTQIRFTDYGWDGDENQLQNFTSISESTVIWESTARIFAGTEIIVDNTGSFTNYTVSGDDLNLSTNGDQVLAYQGPSSDPTFIAALHNDSGDIDGTTRWTEDDEVGNNASRSSLPAGLTNGVNAISFSDDEEDNVEYRGTTTGTVSSLRSTLVNNNGTNWNRRDSAPYTLSSGNNFTIPPDLVSVSPSNGSTTLGSLSQLSITFDDNVIQGTSTNAGDIQLINVTDGNTLTGSFNIGDSEVTFDGSATVTVDISALVLEDGKTYKVDVAEWIFINADGNHNVAIDGTTQWSFNVDAVAPTVLSINRDPLVSANANFGTSQSSVSFIVTFSEDIVPGSLTTVADFALDGSASGGTANINSSITGSGDTYTITVDNINQLGTLTINFTGSVNDLVGNVGSTGRNGDQSFIIINPEPNQQPTALNIVQGADNFTLNASWTPSTVAQLAQGYLIFVVGPTASFPANPTDLITQSNDLDFSDDLGIINSPTPSIVVTGLNSGTEYDFRIFPYTNSGNQIDYKTNATILNGSGTTSFGQTSTLAFSSASPTISSLVNSLGASSTNFAFTITEDGASPAIDNSNTRIDQVVIDVSTGNDIDWTDAIAGVQLSDGTNVFNTDVNGGNITVTDTQITFSNLPNGSGQIGEILDNSAKTYSLNIWLRDPISNATLRNTIDGLNFSFQVSTSGISYEANSSQLAAAQTASSGSTNNAVEVLATTLNWEVQPPATAGVLAQFTSAPVVEAVDANGNRDLNYTGNVTILANTDVLATNNNPAALASPFTTGIYTFDTSPSGFNYSEPGNGTLTMTASGLSASPASNTVTVSYSDNTTIAAAAGVEPTTISSLSTSTPIQVFDFTINDDDTGVTVDDRAPTRILEIVVTAGTGNDVTDWSQVITTARLGSATSTQEVDATIGTNTLTFSGIQAAGATDLGFISDNGFKVFELSIQLSTSIPNALANVIDNQNFVFAITDGNITTAGNGSVLNSPESENSGSGNIAIDVIAQQIDFVVQPSTTFINEIMAPAVRIEASDINGVRDRDYSGNASISSTGSETAPITATLSNGLGIASNVIHNATGTGLTLTATDDLSILTGDVSTMFDIIPGNSESDVVVTGFTYLTNIEYASSQSITTSTMNPVVFEFEIRDGTSGGTGTDTDALPTNVTSISFDIANSTLLRTIGLYDNGDNLIAEVPAATLITFNLASTPLVIPDDGSATYRLRTTFSNVVTDNEQFAFTVNTVTANDQGSNFESTNGAPTAGAAATSSVAGNDNRIEVIATELIFDNIGNAGLNTAFSPVIRAFDINDNLDLDFAELITDYSNNSTNGNLTTLNNPSGAFVAGVFTFDANFQFVQAGEDVTITIETMTFEGTIPFAAAVSNEFDIESSMNSNITLSSSPNPTFEYINFTAANITGAGNAFELARFSINDGGNSFPDPDGAGTNLNAVTFDISNADNIRSIALYNGGVEVAELPGGTSPIAFSGLSGGFTTADDGSTEITVYVTFDPGMVTDGELQQIKITQATVDGGSLFEFVEAGIIVNEGAETPDLRNILNVTATEYIFTQQPGPIEGINTPFGAVPALEARDALSNLDTDYNQDYNISTPEANLNSGEGSFSAGILDLTALQYISTGDGQLTVSDPSSAIPDVTSNAVDVINTAPVLLTTANGVRDVDPDLNAGSVNIPIFGFSLASAQNTVNEPQLTEATIRFNNPLPSVDIRDVFTNFRLFSSLDGNLDVGFNNTTELQIATAGDDFVTFTGLTEILDEDLANQYYYLVVDIQPGANNNLPSIRPSLLFSDVVVSSGSVSIQGNPTAADLQGFDYTFIDARAPAILNLTPTDDNITVNVNTDIIIEFDEAVSTLDSLIVLRQQDDPAFMQILSPPAISADRRTFTFTVPPMTLQPEENYYVNIAPGDDDANTGFIDDSENTFPGITNTTTWNFRTADVTPPVMSAITLSDIHDVGFNFSLSLDEPGTVYYVVVDFSDPGFVAGDFDTFAEIVGGSGLAQGSFSVLFPNQQQTIQVSGLSSNQDFRVYAIAEDAGMVQMVSPVQSSDAQTDGSSTNGVVVTGPTVDVCVGVAQPLTEAIFIREGNNNDFQTINGPTVTYTIGTNSSDFVFDTNASLTITTPSSSDISNLTHEFISSSALRITYDINGTSQRDFIRIDGLQILVTAPSGTGTIERIGGTAVHDGNSETDALVHAQINTISSSVIPTFTFEPDAITFNNQDPLNYELIADPSLILGTNEFSGPGVLGNLNDGYEFDPQGAGLGFNEITLLHTDQFGCTATDTQTITVFDGDDPIPDLADTYCEDSGVAEISITARTGFTLEELEVDVDGLINPAYIADPNVLVLDGINFRFNVDLADSTLSNPGDSIVAVRFSAKYRSNFNAQDSLLVEKLVFIGETPTVSLTVDGDRVDPSNPGQEFDFCEDGEAIQVSGSRLIDRYPNGLSSFSITGGNIAGLTDNGDGTAVLEPEETEVAEDLILTYEFENATTVCKNTEQAIIDINPKPIVSFNNPLGCVDIPYSFESSDPRIDNSIVTTAEIVEYSWDFDDDLNSTSDLEDPSHIFVTAGTYNVEFFVTSNDGCQSDVSIGDVNIGNNPVVDFSFQGIALTEATTFTPEVTNIDLGMELKGLVWEFNNLAEDTVFFAGALNAFDFTFPTTGKQFVTLQGVSNNNCVGTKVDSLFIVPVEPVSITNTYQADFESGEQDWVSWGTNTSWIVNNSGGTTITESADVSLNGNTEFWVTGAGEYNAAEFSFVYSPIFDISALDKPLLSLNTFRDILGEDGAIIEYSLVGFASDGSSNWQLLGDLDESNGIENWYNQRDISELSGANLNDNPSDIGWTLSDSLWRESRQSLTAIKAQGDRFQLRIGFISSDFGAADGFAFDNVFIGEATRTVLIENFRNSSQATDTRNNANILFNTYIDGIDETTDAIVMNYHTDFPGPDPINDTNPIDPSARALFYGFSSSPTLTVDGVVDQSGAITSDWLTDQVGFRALELSPFNIDIDLATDAGNLVITPNITQLLTNVGNDLLIYAVVLEKDVAVQETVASQETEFYYVVRKMLPNAAGLSVATTDIGNPIQFQWNPNGTMDTDDIAVLVFIQDELTKEVYQSALQINVPVPDNITSIEDQLAEAIDLYPNPANQKVTLKLGDALQSDLPVVIYDQYGKTVWERNVVIGMDQVDIDTKDFVPGLYHVQLQPTDGEVVRKRLMIMH